MNGAGAHTHTPEYEGWRGHGADDGETNEMRQKEDKQNHRVPVADLGLWRPLGRRWELPMLFFLSQNITASFHQHTHIHTHSCCLRERTTRREAGGVCVCVCVCACVC